MQDGGRPRLLGVCWQFPAASETFIVDHLTAMADQGWAVSLCCVEADDERLAANRELVLRLDELVVLGRPNSIVRAARLTRAGPVASRQSRVTRHAAELGPALRPVIKRLAPDVIHAYYGLNAAAVGVAQRGRGVPVIADLLGFDLTTVPAAEGWAAYGRLLAGQRLVVHSHFAAGLVREGLGVEPTLVRFSVAPTFVPVERPSHWGTPLALLFVGRLVPQKGADVAIEALELLDQRRATLGARLTIVGDGPERPVLEELARGRRVDFTGALPPDGVAWAMLNHEVLLVPSRSSSSGWTEAYGLVAAEGRACGMRIVASDIGGLPEAAGPGAVLVPPGDPEALADGIERLLFAQPWVTPDADADPEPGATYDEVARELLADKR